MATFTYKGASWTYNEVTALDGRVWMDRNLGASQAATSSIDTASYGDYFQWGRLDDGHQTPTSGITTTLSTTDVPGNANFIYGMGAPSDWRSPQNDNLWKNGLNVPAPAGWRLPTAAEWLALTTAESISNSATAYSSILKISVSGYRSVGNAGFGDQGAQGFYWSSGVSGTNGLLMYVTPAGIDPARNLPRGYGFPVRLIKDLATPSSTMTGVSSIQGLSTITF